ncbi:ribonuclease HII [Pedobacter sp. HMF7647]|uniref:Ribonuclease HII n=1 Tax=Hufsiella arboris TaxID=2695275 RepID=A0A7K1Y8Z0_9SPHI|nr:ribonuclease HII [Hufsiella arboris]MXV51056.1 ribonuclease HII [Hufsiella arboris]
MLLSFYQEDFVEAGCDEAGRGCLAGPVYAAAVILPREFHNEVLTDSKQLSAEDRYKLREIIEKEAVAFAVASVDHEEIDRINILNASFLAMHKALDMLNIRPQYILVDGNRFKKYAEVPHSCIVKGDGKYFSIAAASILAKTYRDDFMQSVAHLHPEYDWINNKGYPTIKHRQAVLDLGFTPFHRKTFRVTDPQLSILFEDEL